MLYYRAIDPCHVAHCFIICDAVPKDLAATNCFRAVEGRRPKFVGSLMADLQGIVDTKRKVVEVYERIGIFLKRQREDTFHGMLPEWLHGFPCMAHGYE